MQKPKITREEKALLTRAALVGAARKLFAANGYHATGTHEIVATAKVTRGALAHYFPKKEDLFLAVFEEVQRDLMDRMEANVGKLVGKDHWTAFRNSLDAFLDAATKPEVQRILLLDGPVVLGWVNWRKLEAHYGLGAIISALESAKAAGLLRSAPIEPMAHLILAVIDEAALLIANAKRPGKVRAEVELALDSLLTGLAEPQIK
ncbi:MAG: TetR/AcrR family transcriptional regulator [Spongiibacteraceae bacterium]